MGAAAVGATIFLPLFLQVVIGARASNSGLLITPMMIGISIGAFVTGHFIRRTGHYKLIPLVASASPRLSFLVFMEITRATPAVYYVLYMTALGLGLGAAGPMVAISVQNSVELRDLGTATSLTSFFRSMGGSFGVAMMGAILFAGLTQQGAPPGLSTSGFLHGGPAMIATLPEDVRTVIVASFAHSFRYVYWSAPRCASSASRSRSSSRNCRCAAGARRRRAQTPHRRPNGPLRRHSRRATASPEL